MLLAAEDYGGEPWGFPSTDIMEEKAANSRIAEYCRIQPSGAQGRMLMYAPCHW